MFFLDTIIVFGLYIFLAVPGIFLKYRLSLNEVSSLKFLRVFFCMWGMKFILFGLLFACILQHHVVGVVAAIIGFLAAKFVEMYCFVSY